MNQQPDNRWMVLIPFLLLALVVIMFVSSQTGDSRRRIKALEERVLQLESANEGVK